MVEKSQIGRTRRTGGIPLLVARYFLRTLQLVCALTTIVIWGADIQGAKDGGYKIHGDWLFSVVVSSASLIVTVVWMVPVITDWRMWFIDAVMALFWLIVFAIWGRNYIPRTCTDNNCQQLKLSAWFSLAAWLLWITTAVVGFILFNKDRIWMHSGSWKATIWGGRRSSSASSASSV